MKGTGYYIRLEHRLPKIARFYIHICFAKSLHIVLFCPKLHS